MLKQSVRPAGRPLFPLRFFTWTREEFAEALANEIKRHARAFKKLVPNLSHSQRMGGISQALGFSGWPTLRSAAEAFVARGRSDSKRPSFLFDVSRDDTFLNQAATAVPLFTRVDRSLPPTETEQTELKDLGSRLALAFHLPDLDVMNTLANLQGAENWDSLFQRRPENSSEPLYYFDAAEDQGAFVESAACRALIEEMDALWQHYSSRDAKQQKKAKQFITKMVKARPDFLEAWLALATIENLGGNYAKADEYFVSGISRAEALIPAGFNSEMPWGRLGNRFYHRLLYNHMRLLAYERRSKEAAALARKQLRLNPGDNLGVRYDLPVLSAAAFRLKSMEVALNKLLKKLDGRDDQAFFVAGLCYLGFGSHQLGLDYFLRALFGYPALRVILLEQYEPDEREWYRGIRYDSNSIWFQYVIATGCAPVVAHLIGWALAQPEVADEEFRLAKLFGSAEGSHNGWHEWDAAVTPAAVELSELLAGRIPGMLMDLAE